MLRTIETIDNTSYIWTSRIIGFIWAFLTACFAILDVFIFVQPQWIGDTLVSPRAGHFGLYSYCVSTIADYEFNCQGTWTDFETILNAPFAVATFFVGFSILLIFICLGLFIVFLFLRARLVYFICAIIQMICAICLFIAIIIYPSGFDDETIRLVCGQNVNDFNIDTCQMRWAYILAIIAFCNILILSMLAFLLGLKQPNVETTRKQIHQKHVVSKYGELNEAFDERTYSQQTIQRR
ncbi:unnamed protein product [Rotaria socialis]|uniref:Uncharacterized protein n=3 Tax=Rotaria socialis TaxID=392032 RepID=A0A818DQF7_9BILA|nr:unnamed protein product [Rotaria socialis]CAF3390377.1 unnamed protein product [Rotaria socialis]CAF3450504.1 unnamed protein product [Rotaria socialis]CAF3528442.1 unnamed protein product [Rotaria socialis]CAF3666022.1 unnamed protein product [Rotaria socialis]